MFCDNPKCELNIHKNTKHGRPLTIIKEVNGPFFTDQHVEVYNYRYINTGSREIHLCENCHAAVELVSGRKV